MAGRSAILGLALLGIASFSPRALAETHCPSAGFTVVEPTASADTRPVRSPNGKTVFVRREAITTSAEITEAELAGDKYDALVRLKFTPEAASRLHDATTNKSGLRLAFVADNDVVMAVTWEGPYGLDADMGVQLSMENGMKRARPLVDALNKCIVERR